MRVTRSDVLFGFGRDLDWTAEAVETEARAAGGDATAQNALGTMYEDGNGGIPKDDAKAAYWYLEAAEQGTGFASLRTSAFLRPRAFWGAPNPPDYQDRERSAVNGFDEMFKGIGQLLGTMSPSSPKLPVDFVRLHSSELRQASNIAPTPFSEFSPP